MTKGKKPGGSGVNPKSDADARATDPEPKASVMDVRIAHILDLMMRYRYRRVATARRLSKEWGVTVGYVKELATEARKRVRVHVTDADEVAAEVGPGLLRALRTAATSKDPRMVANVAGIAGQLLDLTGLKAPKKFEHAGAGGEPLKPLIYIPPEGDE